MATINPNLASIALNVQNQQNGTNIKQDVKADERPLENQKSATSGNSSVTLSELSQDTVDYSQLGNNQTLRSADAVENKQNEANQTTTGLTYASDLQTQSNYLANLSDPLNK